MSRGSRSFFWDLWDNGIEFICYVCLYLRESNFMLPLEESMQDIR